MARKRAPAEPDLGACTCVTDLEAVARRNLPQGVYDYYAGGAEDEQTVAANREAFRKVYLRPRALVGVGRIETSVTVLGTHFHHPTAGRIVSYRDAWRFSVDARG